MSHWYKFQISSDTYIVCKAERKSQVIEVLPFKAAFKNCVSRDNVPPLRDDPHHVVFNSVNRLKESLPVILPHIESLQSQVGA